MLNMSPMSLLFRRSIQVTTKQDNQHLLRVLKRICNLAAFNDIIFVLFSVAFVCFRSSSYAASFHLYGRALDAGISKTSSTWMLSGYALGSLVGRLFVSFVANISCVNRVALTGSLMVLITIVSCAIPFFDEIYTLLLLSTFVGVFQGMNFITNILILI